MGTLNLLIGYLADRLRHVPLLGESPALFQINLSTRYRPAAVPLRTLLVAMCAVLSLGILWSLGQAALGYREARTIEVELERVRQLDVQLVAEAQQEGIDLSEGALQGLSAEVDLANQLLEKRTFSWTKFLAGLEQVIPARLALSSVQFDAGGTVVHLTGTAMSLEDITAFTVSLQDHPMFKDPVLAQHRAGTNGLVEFNVTLRYRQTGT
ncbi:MAG: PilN domain-containing protein [Nitrospira sp.]|nr:PilN domain-containing protein [Nitrospira sp.]MBH0180633.1 PilN domain-containing protein [Nitrospira sp.]MBH0185423.1 PilN domain-containing protein [Nitrospira sp.]